MDHEITLLQKEEALRRIADAAATALRETEKALLAAAQIERRCRRQLDAFQRENAVGLAAERLAGAK